MQIHLKTLGCRLNEAELEQWAQAFQNAGHRITREVEKANVVVINSCAVTQDAARKSRNLIRRIHRENPHSKLVVSGCYASLNSEEAASLLGVDLVVYNRDKDRLVEKTLSELNLDSMPVLSTEPGTTSLFTRGRQRAFVKVQDGCRYRCTFCIVTVARGAEKSRSIHQVIGEINTLQEQGIDEVVLTGVHLGGYGSDNGCCLTDLIAAVLADTGIKRLRLGSLEPWELTDDFYRLFDNPRMMPHLHLPLQSGCNSVLRRMARRCNSHEFSAIVNRLRSLRSNFNVTTDIMVGFPGETEREWKEGLEFIEKTGFGDVHVFSYSRREGTKAAVFPDQINDSIKKQRSKELHHLVDTMKLQFHQQQLGKTVPVLWEAYTESLPNGRQMAFGYSPNYVKVACVVDQDKSLENQIIKAKLTDIHGNGVIAELAGATV